MKVIRIHSVGFRRLFIMYHALAAMGCLVLICVFCLSANQSYTHMFLIIAGILMVVLPLCIAPPEIMLDLKEELFVFRKGIHYSKVSFSEIKALTIDTGILRIRHIQNAKTISIHQEHFIHIPLPDMKDYIHKILAGNTKIDKRQYNSVKIV